MNNLFIGVIIVIGIIVSFKINTFLSTKYSEYRLTRNMIKISILISIIFSIMIGFKINRNIYFNNAGMYMLFIYVVSSGVMSGVLSSSFIIDLLFKELPDENNILIGLSVFVLSVNQLGYKVIFSSIIMFIIFFTLSVITGQFGMGDVKMLFFMGFGILPHKMLSFIFIAFLFASIYLLFMFIFKKCKGKDMIPFGPFLIISFLLTIL